MKSNNVNRATLLSVAALAGLLAVVFGMTVVVGSAVGVLSRALPTSLVGDFSVSNMGFWHRSAFGYSFMIMVSAAIVALVALLRSMSNKRYR